MRCMSIVSDQRPDDIAALKKLVANQRTKIDHFTTRYEQVQTKVTALQEQPTIALAKRYAASSEKISPEQNRLFDEAAAALADDVTDYIFSGLRDIAIMFGKILT